MYIQIFVQYVYVTGLIDDKYLSFSCHLSSPNYLYAFDCIDIVLYILKIVNIHIC